MVGLAAHRAQGARGLLLRLGLLVVGHHVLLLGRRARQGGSRWGMPSAGGSKQTCQSFGGRLVLPPWRSGPGSAVGLTATRRPGQGPSGASSTY